MEFTSKTGFSKQIIIFIQNSKFNDAFTLAQQFVQRFPDEMMSHFLLAKSAFWINEFDITKSEARKAFNLAKLPDDMLPCAILAATAYHQLKEYEKGFDLLKQMEAIKTDEELEKLLFLFSLALKDQTEAMKHIDLLFKINSKAAEDLIVRYLESIDS